MRQLRLLLSAALFGLVAFVSSEAIALAQSDEQTAGQAFAQQEARAALACPGAASVRAAGRHFFTLAEAQECAPGAAISLTGKFTPLRITPTSNFTGYSQTLIVQSGTNQYSIERLTNLDGLGKRAVLASGCPENSVWNEGGWHGDGYINNSTGWARYWNYCGGNATHSHARWVSPSCVAFWPYVCNGSTPYVYGDWSSDVYTSVSDTYGSFCCSATWNAWQGMSWDSRGWFNYSAWMSS
jgi:hypothetical protein